MAGTKLSEISELNTLDDYDIFLIFKNNKIVNKVTFGNLKKYFKTDSNICITRTLPKIGISDKLYLVVNSSGKTNDIFDAYVWKNSGWEFIGNKHVELSNYYTKEDIDNKLEEIKKLING